MNKLLVLFMLFCMNTFSQSVNFSGHIIDNDSGQFLSGVSIILLEANEGAVSKKDGGFEMTTDQQLPITVVFELLGYADQTKVIRKKNQKIEVRLLPATNSLDEVVVSASRTPERIFESPVSIERLSPTDIKNTTSPTFYDGLQNLKGVDVNTSSLTFKSVNTRGFSLFSNGRFVQLVDGMDNASPGLNFAVGNLVGMNELDVHSVEVLPGASSALYGANAFNGILFMKSKNPFTHQGLSAYAKTGITNADNSGPNEFYDAGFRYAKKVDDFIAFKITASYLKATDWSATDTSNVDENGVLIAGDRQNTLDYDGLNIYGDLIKTNIRNVALGLEGSDGFPVGSSALVPNEIVSRTGYAEQDLSSNNTDNFKASFALHYRPYEGAELIYNSNVGTGNSIYQGGSRYALRNFILHQHKVELQTEHLTARVYATIEDAGDSYDLRFTGINTLAPSNNLWYGNYVGAFLQAKGASLSDAAAHTAARTAADAAATPAVGSELFNNLFSQVVNDPNLTSGAKFIDRSKMYHADANYNFKEDIKFAEIQIGGSARQFILDSDGTIFTDTDIDAISFSEFGLYAQAQKKWIDDRLKLTGSLRYDKSQNFEGKLSPRISLSFSPDEKKNHIIRASFQTGFRNPTAQDQYNGLNFGSALVIGTSPENPSRVNRLLRVSSEKGVEAVGGNGLVNFNGEDAKKNSFTRSSVEAFGDAVKAAVPQIIAASEGAKSVAQAQQEAALLNLGVLQKAEVRDVMQEQVSTFEIGYRGKLASKTVLDFSTYYSRYKNFISNTVVLAPLYGDISQIDTADPTNINNQLLLNAVANQEFQAVAFTSNTDADVASYGLDIGLETQLFGGYQLGFSYSLIKQVFDQSEDPGFSTNFNTPNHKIKWSFGHPNVYKNVGFGVNLRWQDKYLWESAYSEAVIPSRTLLDAQVSYRVEKWNSTLKLGGANLTNTQYVSAPGTGLVGSQIFISWNYNL